MSKRIGPMMGEILIVSVGLKHLDPPKEATRSEKLRAAKLRNLVARANLYIDVSGLPNPHYVDELRGLTGRDEAISAYLLAQPDVRQLLDHTWCTLNTLIPGYALRGNNHGTVTVVFRCTGGKHRSQFFAEQARVMVNDMLAGFVEPVKVTVRHVRDELGGD